MIISRKISVMLLIGILGCNGGTKDQSVSATQSGPEIDKIRLKDLKDLPIDLKQYRGKTIFINFWATWCKPCIEEMPTIEKAQNILKNENVVFLLASNESVKQIENFKNNHDYDFNYVRLENMEELNIQALPTTYIFSPEGNLVFSEMGYRKWDNPSNINLILKIVKQE